MADKKTKIKKEKKDKIPLSVFEKCVIAISVILVVLTIVCGVAKHTLDSIKIVDVSDLSGQSLEIDEKKLKILDFVIPETMDIEDSTLGDTYEVGVKVNMDFKADDANSVLDYLNIIDVYDWDGKKIENEETIKKYDTKGSQLKLMVMLQLIAEFTKIKKIITNVFIVLILLDIVAAVFVAYIIWKRKDDEREKREKELRESEIRKVTGISEEEARRPKKSKKKKKKK